MPTPKEPEEKPAETQQTSTENETLSLVDFFDRMDRAAFKRALEDKDRHNPATSGT